MHVYFLLLLDHKAFYKYISTKLQNLFNTQVSGGYVNRKLGMPGLPLLSTDGTPREALTARNV